MADLRQTQIEQWIGRILRFGVWGSASLMTVGLFFTAFFPPEFFRWPIQAITIVQSGLLLLMVTPVLRVLTTSISFMLQKDWRFFSISFLVFCVLIIELVSAFQ